MKYMHRAYTFYNFMYYADEIVGSVTSYMKSLPSPFVAVYTATQSSHTVSLSACIILLNTYFAILMAVCRHFPVTDEHLSCIQNLCYSALTVIRV